jgi:hypothetical protein
MDTFLSQAEKSRVQASDEGLQGLIAAGLAKTEKDAAVKAQLEAVAQQKVAFAKAAKDETLKWDEELAKIKEESVMRLLIRSNKPYHRSIKSQSCS